VAKALRHTCRRTDLAARYGGDEFYVLALALAFTPDGLRLAAARPREARPFDSRPEGSLAQDRAT
jgi:GGDEF domain-containing protein